MAHNKSVKTSLSAAIFFGLFALGGCDQRAEEQYVSTWETKGASIKTALESLLLRTNEDAFVTFVAEPSGSFVQFAQTEGQLLLDLPEQPLDKGSMRRAVRFFQDLGVSIERSPMLSEPDGEVVGHVQYFSMNLNQNVDRATELTVDIFSEIYQLHENFELRIQEN